MSKPYYLAYEERYQKVQAAGVDIWGHKPNDETLYQTLENWVSDNNLAGKKVAEFACGEGASGVILSRLGCIYHGFDIAPSAIAKARELLEDYPNATVTQLDLVNGTVEGVFDAAVDCMGFHMIVVDSDRRKYLSNAHNCLKPNAALLFFRQSYKADAIEAAVETFEDWIKISNDDYTTPRKFSFDNEGQETEIMLTYVPGRANNKAGYCLELQAAGFYVDEFVEMESSRENPSSATIYAHKQ